MSKALTTGLEVAITCPKCGPATKLKVRENHQNGSQFLGCPNWPQCDHTQGIPEHVKMEAAGQPRLFNL